jgi:hypothetical protein
LAQVAELEQKWLRSSKLAHKHNRQVEWRETWTNSNAAARDYIFDFDNVTAALKLDECGSTQFSTYYIFDKQDNYVTARF